jgi:hypothetical protein
MISDAHKAASAAREVVAKAKAVHARAEHEYEQARSAVILLDQRHTAHLHAGEGALRQYSVLELENGFDRSAIVARAQLCEKALVRSRQELAEVEGKAGEPTPRCT